jgi:hypothetical protein
MFACAKRCSPALPRLMHAIRRNRDALPSYGADSEFDVTAQFMPLSLSFRRNTAHWLRDADTSPLCRRSVRMSVGKRTYKDPACSSA